MKLIYLDSSKSDLSWFRTYYESVFPSGATPAGARYLKAIDTLTANPYIGPSIGQDSLRKLVIAKTPFVVFYRVTGDRIEVVRVWDQRADPARLGFQEEAATLA